MAAGNQGHHGHRNGGPVRAGWRGQKCSCLGAGLFLERPVLCSPWPASAPTPPNEASRLGERRSQATSARALSEAGESGAWQPGPKPAGHGPPAAASARARRGGALGHGQEGVWGLGVLEARACKDSVAVRMRGQATRALQAKVRPWLGAAAPSAGCDGGGRFFLGQLGLGMCDGTLEPGRASAGAPVSARGRWPWAGANAQASRTTRVVGLVGAQAFRPLHSLMNRDQRLIRLAKLQLQHAGVVQGRAEASARTAAARGTGPARAATRPA